MHAQKTTCWLLIWLAFFPFTGRGQSIADLTKLYPSQVAAYDLEEGLPISCTWNGILDKKGRLWINPCFQLPSYRTINFYQFDGRNSEMINLDGLPEGAAGQAALACQNEEGLLFGFFRDSDHFFSFDPDSHETSFFQLGREDASIIFMDYEPEFGLIVLAISPGKHYAYQLQKDTVELLMEYSSDIVSDSKLSPYFYLQRRQVLSNGQLWFLDVPNNDIHDPSKWIGKDRFNLLQLNLHTRELKRHSNEGLLAEAPPPSKIPSFKLTLASDTQGHILLGMSGPIYQIDPQNGNTLLKWIFPYENFKDPIQESYRVEKDAKGNLLFLFRDTSNKFLAILLDTNGKLYDYSEIMQAVARNARSGFELSYTINVFSTDFLRNLLVFTEGGLVMVELSYHASISTHLKGIATRAIMEWEPGQYLVRTENTDRYDGLYSINPFSSSNPEMIFEAPKLKEAQIPVDEYSNLIHRDGYYWYKSRQNLIRLDKNQDHQSFPVGISFNRFTFLNAYTVAVAELNGALYFYDLNARERRPWLENGAPLQLKGEVNELLLTKDSTLWVASLQELLQIDLKSGKTQHIGKEQGFLDNRMMSLHEDEQGQLWVGTYGEGIYIYDPASGHIKVINQKSGLSNNTVIGILSDEEGIRWASTFKGINLISPEGEVLGQLYQEDGLSTNEFNRYSYGKGSDGRLLFGSINGVNALDPETIKKRLLSAADLSIYLKSITRFDPDQGADRTQYVGFNELERLFLPAGHRHIILDFALSNRRNKSLPTKSMKLASAIRLNGSTWATSVSCICRFYHPAAMTS